MASDDHAKGLAITLAGVLVLTPDVLLIRLTAIDDFSLAVGRGLLGGLAIFAVCAVMYRGDFARRLVGLGLWGLAVALLSGVGSIIFYAAIERSSVANVLVISSTSPLIAAVMSWIFLGERVAPATWLAILGALAGLILVASGSLAAGHIAGDLLALGDALAVAAVFTIVRRHRAVNMIPAAGLGMFIGAALALPFAAFPPMAAEQWLWLLLGGALVLPAAVMLLTLGPRYLPTPEVAMLTLLETVLGPLWVWLVIGEEPGTRTLLGGAIVVGALFAHAAWRLRRAPAPGLAR
jgi:drug/metabolite transporter (DMT)-like permease